LADHGYRYDSLADHGYRYDSLADHGYRYDSLADHGYRYDSQTEVQSSTEQVKGDIQYKAFIWQSPDAIVVTHLVHQALHNTITL